MKISHRIAAAQGMLLLTLLALSTNAAARYFPFPGSYSSLSQTQLKEGGIVVAKKCQALPAYQILSNAAPAAASAFISACTVLNIPADYPNAEAVRNTARQAYQTALSLKTDKRPFGDGLTTSQRNELNQAWADLDRIMRQMDSGEEMDMTPQPELSAEERAKQEAEQVRAEQARNAENQRRKEAEQRELLAKQEAADKKRMQDDIDTLLNTPPTATQGNLAQGSSAQENSTQGNSTQGQYAGLTSPSPARQALDNKVKEGAPPCHTISCRMMEGWTSVENGAKAINDAIGRCIWHGECFPPRPPEPDPTPISPAELDRKIAGSVPLGVIGGFGNIDDLGRMMAGATRDFFPNGDSAK